MVEHVELILQAVLDFTCQTAGPRPFCVSTDRGQTGPGLEMCSGCDMSAFDR